MRVLINAGMALVTAMIVNITNNAYQTKIIIHQLFIYINYVTCIQIQISAPLDGINLTKVVETAMKE